MSMSRVARAGAVILAVVVAVAILSAQRQVDDCQAAVRDSGTALRSNSAPAIRRAADGLASGCRGSQTLARAAGFYQGVGRTREAIFLARVAVKREPENYTGWAVLAVAARKSDEALATRARRRALALNPRAGRGS